MSYSYKIKTEADYAKARVEDINASFKDLTEVCYNIRGRPTNVAIHILEDAAAGKIPLRYRSHNTRMAHRKELQGQKGRWPIKCAGIVLKCLQSAVANAKEKGLSEELIVTHASANKKHSYMRYSSKGRRNTSKFETARVEVILREKIEGKKKRIADQKKAVEEKKKADALKKAEKTKKVDVKTKEIKPASETPAKTSQSAKGESAVKPKSAVEKPTEKKGENTTVEKNKKTEEVKKDATKVGVEKKETAPPEKKEKNEVA